MGGKGIILAHWNLQQAGYSFSPLLLAGDLAEQ